MSEVGRFPFTKKFGNFLLGVCIWEKRVPFVTSPILGRRGRLIDLERHGTGDKDCSEYLISFCVYAFFRSHVGFFFPIT